MPGTKFKDQPRNSQSLFMELRVARSNNHNQLRSVQPDHTITMEATATRAIRAAAKAQL